MTRLALALGLCSLFPVAEGLAAPLKLAAMNLDGAPYMLAATSAHTLETGKGSAGQRRLTFEVKNTSPAPFDRIDVMAVVLSREWQSKGFFGFTVRSPFAPGVWTHVVYRTAELKTPLLPTDRLVLVPRTASGKALSWRIDPEVQRAMLADVAEAKGDLSALAPIWSAAQTPPEPGNEPEPGRAGCTSDCAQLEASCTNNCKCGLQSFSCSCSSEQISHTCSCYQCPTGPGS